MAENQRKSFVASMITTVNNISVVISQEILS